MSAGASMASCRVVYLTRAPHETRDSPTQSAGWYFYFSEWPETRPAVGPYASTQAALDAAAPGARSEAEATDGS